MKTIVFAVPEMVGFSYLIEALIEAGYDVIVCTDADTVLETIEKTRCSGLITDNLLAHGESFTFHETSEGTQTGNVLARHLLKNHPELPVVLFGPEDNIPDLPDEITYECMVNLTPRSVVGFAESFK